MGIVAASSVFIFGLDEAASAIAIIAASAAGASLALVLALRIVRPAVAAFARLQSASRALDSQTELTAAPEVRATFTGEVAALEASLLAAGERLRRLEGHAARLEAMTASTADALFALDRTGVVRYGNAAAVSLFGTVVGRQFVEVVRHHELSDITAMARAGERGTSAPLYLDSRGVWLQAGVSPIAAGGEWSALVILRDVTELRKTEITRRDFVANVSHELRTPLAGIKAVVETLRDGALDDPEAATEFLSRADAEVDRLIHLVDELLQLARLEAGAEMAMTAVDLRQLLAGAVNRFTHQADRAEVRLALGAGDATFPVRADPARLGQAIGNLIHNAIKFTASGGWVRVEARQTGSESIISVADSGRGIDADDLPRVFERFYITDRARSEGSTGLGLAIVKHVVLAHGGSIDAESTLGVGSTFRVHLPRQNESAN